MTPLDIFVNLQLWTALGLAVTFMTYCQRGSNFTAPHLLAMAFFWPAFLIFYGLQRYRDYLYCKNKDPDKRLH